MLLREISLSESLRVKSLLDAWKANESYHTLLGKYAQEAFHGFSIVQFFEHM
jgi:hypothetical protein